MSHHLIEMQQVEYTYPDGMPALQDISLRITHGESVALIGANGAGKSTLLLHLNGYFTPTKGAVRIGDFPLTKKTLLAIRRTVGMIFQDPDDQLFMPTVYDDVAFGPLNLGLPREDVHTRVMHALETVGLAHLKEKPHNGRITADAPTLDIFRNSALLEKNHLEQPLSWQSRTS